MKLNSKLNTFLVLGLILVGMAACSHGPVVQEFPATANAAEEVQKLSSEMQTALNEQVNVLAPNTFEKAQNSLNSARKEADKSKDSSKDILHQVALGHSYLNQAKEFAKLAKSNMEEVVAARQLAIQTGAPQLFTKDFDEVDENLKDVTSDVEKNDLEGTSKNRGKLQAAYRELELRSIQQNSLGQARQTVNQALAEGAKEYASQTLAIAEKKIDDTAAFIVANRHESGQIKVRSQDAIASANHLLKITRNSKASEKASSEDTALQMEKEQGRTQDKQAQLTQEREAATVLAKGASALAKERLSLESEQAFAQSFETARAQFTEQEAEVYKQGDKLLIRLKGLEFPVAKSSLKGSNFPLLAKVQKVIVEFGKSSVIVEGHTDSDGGQAMNHKLSTERAQAVSDYLKSTIPGDQVDISAVGYGYQKPLTTNKTSVGKAKNRRVDIIIAPERTPS